MDDMEIAMNSPAALAIVNIGTDVSEIADYISHLGDSMFNLCPEDVTAEHAAIAKRCLAQLRDIAKMLERLETL